MIYDHIKARDALKIQNLLDKTDVLFSEYTNTTKKPIDNFSINILYDTSILTQIVKNSLPLNPNFQITILAIQLKCFSHIFKKNSPGNSDFFKFWRNADTQIKDKLISKIDTYSVHQDYFYLLRNHPESKLNFVINKYFNALLELVIYENQDAKVEVKERIENTLSNSLIYTDEYLHIIKKELLRTNQLNMSDGKILIPSASDLQSLLSSTIVKNQNIEYEYYSIANKAIDFLERLEVKILKVQADFSASDNTTALTEHLNQLCNLTRVYNYIYLLILKLQECSMENNLLSFQTITQSMGKLEILNTHFEESMLSKLDSLIEINQMQNDQLNQLSDFAQIFSESLKQTNNNLMVIGKRLESLEQNLNQILKHSLNMIDFSLQSGFLHISRQIQDLNSKVNLQTLISSVNYYKNSKIQISVNRELNKLR